MIEPVTQSNIMEAAMVHAKSWKESHREICSADFIAGGDCLHSRQLDFQSLCIAKRAEQRLWNAIACICRQSLFGHPFALDLIYKRWRKTAL